jgi:hypothetical protein
VASQCRRARARGLIEMGGPRPPKGVAATADPVAVRIAVVDLLVSVGFDGPTAKDQGEAIAKLWLDNLSAGQDAQRSARFATGGIDVRGPTGAPPPPAASGAAKRYVAGDTPLGLKDQHADGMWIFEKGNAPRKE